ncbi:FAD-binding oxidoreductase [Pseudonocardia benzenivorans]
MTVTLLRADGAREHLSDDVLDELDAALRGTVVLGGTDPGAPEPCPEWNAMYGDPAALTARCTGTADVVEAVRFARERGLLVGVRAGGHSVAGLSSVPDGLLIDLSGMRGVMVDPQRRLARVQGGALLGDVDRETQAFGLATPLGRVSETGVAGLTLGGGYGHLNAKYGLSCDNLVEAQVVCADGSVRTASETDDADLFWAIRGGGGNFGVVTSFTFRLHPVGPIVAFAGVMYPLEDLGTVERSWREYAAAAPDEVTTFVVTMTFPAAPGMPEIIHDRPVAIVAAVHCGPDPDEGMRVLQPLRELGTPLFDLSQPMPYAVVQASFDPFFPGARCGPTGSPSTSTSSPTTRSTPSPGARRTGPVRSPWSTRSGWAAPYTPWTRRPPRSPNGPRRGWSRSTRCGATRSRTRPRSRGAGRPGRR